jgi:hypothetical protein
MCTNQNKTDNANDSASTFVTRTYRACNLKMNTWQLKYSVLPFNLTPSAQR